MEFFFKDNDRDIELEFEFLDLPSTELFNGQPIQVLNRLSISIPRGQNVFSLKHQIAGPWPGGGFSGTVVNSGSGPQAQMAHVFQTFDAFSKARYIGAFRNALNIGTNQNYYDIKVGQSFISEWRTFKTGVPSTNNEAIYTLTSQIKELLGIKDLDINPSPDDQTLQLFIEGRSFKLHELGSGLPHLVIVLANIAIQKPTYLLIDEPELSLHPKLQLKFIQTLNSYASHGLWFATHSMGLARSTADRIYTVQKSGGMASDVKDYLGTTRLANFLAELTFSGYVDMGFDVLLLVEGPSDTDTIKQFLRWYKKEQKVLVLDLGGSSCIKAECAAQLEEFKRITKNITVLIDSERDNATAALKPDREEFTRVCKQSGIPCYVLDRRAMENYLSERAIKKVKGEKYRALGHFDARNEVTPMWRKAENWVIAKEMKPEELAETDLGKIIQSI
jgi:energy-coupling factor transporter ATP-binding protein EcfA2